ncbi:MAG: glycosyltransferase, partial [Colwellia sp.]
MKKITVDIVIPVLNEEESLEANIEKIVIFTNTKIAAEFQCHIIIADNGSTDSTEKIAKRIELDSDGKVSYHRVARRGVGLALKSVWTISDADFVGYMDLDLATDLNHLPSALEALAYNESDVVYGTRLNQYSIVTGRSVLRGVISRVFNTILKHYLNVSFSDGMCGFKFLKREYIPKLLAKGAVSDGWFFCTELLVVAEWLNLRLYELPVNWKDDPNSKVKVGSLTLEYI